MLMGSIVCEVMEDCRIVIALLFRVCVVFRKWLALFVMGIAEALCFLCIVPDVSPGTAKYVRHSVSPPDEINPVRLLLSATLEI